MTYQDLSKIVKSKEDVLVQYDCMKLELKKIKEHLNGASDEVFDLENRKISVGNEHARKRTRNQCS